MLTHRPLEPALGNASEGITVSFHLFFLRPHKFYDSSLEAVVKPTALGIPALLGGSKSSCTRRTFRFLAPSRLGLPALATVLQQLLRPRPTSPVLPETRVYKRLAEFVGARADPLHAPGLDFLCVVANAMTHDPDDAGHPLA